MSLTAESVQRLTAVSLVKFFASTVTRQSKPMLTRLNM